MGDGFPDVEFPIGSGIPERGMVSPPRAGLLVTQKKCIMSPGDGFLDVEFPIGSGILRTASPTAYYPPQGGF